MALFQVDFYSETLQMCTNMQVLLPQNVSRHGYQGTTEAGFPSLLLLHGMHEDHTVWMRRTALERYVDTTSLAVIMPAAHLGFYTDMAHGPRYEAYFREELPQIIHEFFPQLSERRSDHFIGGLSMGGYGAVKLALQNPERYAKAFSFSGPLDLLMQAQHMELTDYWRDVFGSLEQLEQSDNNLSALAVRTAARAKQLPEFYLWCGATDPLLPLSQSGAARLSGLGYTVTSHVTAGAHNWDCWDRELPAALDWLLGNQK